MSEPTACLPMYDWPEVRDATDALWAAVRDAMRARGLAAPDALTRDEPSMLTDPGLALGQTCGSPYRARLHTQVTLIGAPDYGLVGCPPGYYRSALVVRAEDPRGAVMDFSGARYAYNAVDSQSGWMALEAALGTLSPESGLRTGAHRTSIRAVADGAAEIAAIDAVSWRLAQRWEPAAARLRVVGWTRATPGLPMVTAGGRDAGPYAAAIDDGIAALDPSRRDTLGVRGFVRFAPRDYFAMT